MGAAWVRRCLTQMKQNEAFWMWRKWDEDAHFNQNNLLQDAEQAGECQLFASDVVCDYGVWRNEMFRVRRMWVTIRARLDSLSPHTHTHTQKNVYSLSHHSIDHTRALYFSCEVQHWCWWRWSRTSTVIFPKSTLLLFLSIRTCCSPSTFTTCWWNYTGVYWRKAALLPISFLRRPFFCLL